MHAVAFATMNSTSLSSPRLYLPLAICVTGMYRTLDDPRVQRSMKALFGAFPSADIYTVIGVDSANDTWKGGQEPHKFADVERTFKRLVGPQQRVTHRHLSHNEEMWARCNSTMVSQFHKWALCFRQVEDQQVSAGRTYEWVLRTRNDMAWAATQDRWLRLPRPHMDRVIIQGRDTAASDWFIFVPGRHVRHLFHLPNAPCSWGGSTRSWSMWFRFMNEYNFTRLPLNEGRGGWPWPVEIIRTAAAVRMQGWCRQHGATVDSCFDLTSSEVQLMMLSSSPHFHRPSRDNLMQTSTFDV